MSNAKDPFTSFYRREVGYVARTLRCFGVAPDEVDDALQDVFLVLHRRWRELDPALPVRTWLHAVARRVSGNRRRARARRKTDSLEPLEQGLAAPLAACPAPLPDDQLATKQVLGRLQVILKRLPPGRRAVYLLTVVDELTAAEIALRVRSPRNTVSSQLRIARSEVRSALARQSAAHTIPSAPDRVRLRPPSRRPRAERACYR